MHGLIRDCVRPIHMTDSALSEKGLVSDQSKRKVPSYRKPRNVSLIVGVALLGAMVLIAILAPLIAPHDPYQQKLVARLIPPIWAEKSNPIYILGTDNLGRDYLSRLIYGVRISLIIGISVMLISGVIGTVLGLLAGYFGGIVDTIVSFFIATRLAMPLILVSLAVVALFGSSLPIILMVLGFLKWDRFAVVMRAATQQIRGQDYVAAAQAAGASTPRIIFCEIIPNILPQLAVVASIEAASAILLEAGLSFLGLGVQPPTPSWGLMIAEARPYMFSSFWLIVLPGSLLALLVLAINMTGDGIRDAVASSSGGINR